MCALNYLSGIVTPLSYDLFPFTFIYLHKYVMSVSLPTSRNDSVRAIYTSNWSCHLILESCLIPLIIWYFHNDLKCVSQS